MKKPRIKKLKTFNKQKIDELMAKLPSRGDEPAEGQLIESPVPAITNETVAEHREKVLGKARKYIYPLQHSKHKIVLISSAIFISVMVAFFSYTTLALYRLKSNTGFLYGVTKVIPFPIAKVGPNFISYENYLFELRHYVHYYQSQEQVNFNTDVGKRQLDDYKTRALQKVIDDVYVRQLAEQNHVSISGRELSDEITLVRSQNRLGSNEKGFEDVLKDNFGWTINDFKRSLKQEMLAQKLVATLDTDTSTRAQTAYNLLKKGADFKTIAKKYSDDINSKNNGGQYGYLISQSNRDLSAQVTQTLFMLKPGQISGIINTGYTLEIVKCLEVQGKSVKAAHIVFTLKDISVFLNPLKDKEKARVFIGF